MKSKKWWMLVVFLLALALGFWYVQGRKEGVSHAGHQRNHSAGRGMNHGGMGMNQEMGQPKRKAIKPEDMGKTLVSVRPPLSLSSKENQGKMLFEAKCMVCHGKRASGKNGMGPPLVHVFYAPGHHPDEAFQRAVAQGVVSHHWPFGNMLPVSGLDREQVEKITAYVRKLQRANGIGN